MKLFNVDRLSASITALITHIQSVKELRKANLGNKQVLLKNLKLSSAGLTITTGTFPAGSTGSVTVRNCDSANTINSFEYHTAMGSVIESTRVYANDTVNFDSVPHSWKVTTTAECNEHYPFYLPPLTVWNTSTSTTATVETIKEGATLYTTAEMWMEVEWADNASFPNYTFTSTRSGKPIVEAGAAGTAGAATWTDSDTVIAAQGKQKLSTGSITPAANGLMSIQIVVAATSVAELWIDPQIRLA